MNDLAQALSEYGISFLMVENTGLEPATSYMRSKRSPRLS